MTEYTAFLRQLALDRRALLSGMFASGVTAAVRAVPGVAPPDTAEDLAAAQRIAGLQFSPEQLAMAASNVERQKRGFEQLRAHALSWWTAPAWNFDPLPRGVAAPATGAKLAVDLPAGDLSTKPEDLAYASIPHLAALLKARKVTSRQLTELSLGRLKRFDAQLNCVVTLLEAQALAAADAADAELAAGTWRGPLHGIPYGAKDLFAWPGAPTTFGAAPFKDQVLDVEATVLGKLKAAGAVLCAKLSLGALAMGDYWFKGRTRNPWNTEQGSSGSSAGSASAVSAGLLPFALGTETLGSIVSPCTACGVAGLRPTFGVVSRHGAMPLSWSMDKVGPIARHAVDLAIVFEAIRGADGKDTMVRDIGFAWPPRGLKGLRVGVVQGRAVRGGRRGGGGGDTGPLVPWLREQGAEISDARLPEFPYGAIRTILTVEGATAFDDLTRSPDIDKLTRQTPGSWPNLFRSARFVPAVEYLRATRVRTELIQAMHEATKGIDVLIAPRSSDALVCTNLTGHPTVVLPTGAGRRDKTPSSSTVIGRLYGESTVLAVADAWQRDTRWHLGRPL